MHLVLTDEERIKFATDLFLMTVYHTFVFRLVYKPTLLLYLSMTPS